MRVEDSMRMSMSGDQYRGTLGRQYVTVGSQHLPVSCFPGGSHPASQYSLTCRQPLPVPPVSQIVQQTNSLLSQIGNWNPISLQPSQVAPATTASQSTQPHLVNISNSKYASLDASSSVAQKLIKNIQFLGRAFSGSSVTLKPTDSVTATAGSAVSGTSSSALTRPVLPVLSTEQEGAAFGQRHPETARNDVQPPTTSSNCDPVIANVLKSIGFNVDLSKFDPTVVPKTQQQEQYSASGVQYIPAAQPVPMLVAHEVAPVQLNTSTVSQYDNILEMGTFSEIKKVLQKVRERSKTKQHSKSPAKQQSRSQSRHRSLSRSKESRSGEREKPVVRRSPAKQKPKQQQTKQQERAAQWKERHLSHKARHDVIPRRASPSPRQHDDRRTSRRKSRSRSPSPYHHLRSPHRHRRSDVRKRNPSPKPASPLKYSASPPRHVWTRQEHHQSPKLVSPVSYPAHPYHLPSPVYSEKKPIDIEWEKRAEEFIRRLQEPSRPNTTSAPSAAHSYIRSIDDDLSSISSGSLGGFVEDNLSELRFEDDVAKIFAAAKSGNSDQSKSKNMAMDATGRHRHGVAGGPRASNTKPCSNIKVCGLALFLLVVNYDNDIISTYFCK